jgi:hypothetical protein
VKAGTKVSWINTDDVPHLIVKRPEQVQAISGTRHRPEVQRDAHETWNVQLFLRAASEDAGGRHRQLASSASPTSIRDASGGTIGPCPRRTRLRSRYALEAYCY